MKGFLYGAAVVVCFASGAMAGNNYTGSNSLCAGFAVGGLYDAYGDMQVQPIFLGFDHRIAGSDLSLGLGLGYASSIWYYDNPDWGYEHYSYLILSGRGDYHLNHLLRLDAPEWDTYAGLGINIASSFRSGPDYEGYPAGSHSFFDVFVGARYFFAPQWALMGEVGTGVGIIKIGVSHTL